jgi:hypothetical protein
MRGLQVSLLGLFERPLVLELSLACLHALLQPAFTSETGVFGLALREARCA